MDEVFFLDSFILYFYLFCVRGEYVNFGYFCALGKLLQGSSKREGANNMQINTHMPDGLI